MAAGDGLVTMTPTSIAVAGAGSSASINSDGGVDFTSATSLSLNGVFTSSFDNYVFYVNLTAASNTEASFRFRASGTDATGANYTGQRLDGDDTSVFGSRYTSATSVIALQVSSTARNGYAVHLYGPALSQPTAFRSVSVRGTSSAYIMDMAYTHSLSTAYDGFTLYNATAFSGNIAVFGYEE